MKTIEQYIRDFARKVSAREIYRADVHLGAPRAFTQIADENEATLIKEVIEARDAEWRKELGKDRGVKGFDEWWSIDGLVQLDTSDKDYRKIKIWSHETWTTCESIWRHKCLNIEQASSMKIAILERKVAELQSVIDSECDEKTFDYSQYCQSIRYHYDNQLKDAEEVIAFYADPDSWQGSEMVEELPDDQNIDAVSPNTPWHTPVMVCGKRAREYFKKHGESK